MPGAGNSPSCQNPVLWHQGPFIMVDVTFCLWPPPTTLPGLCSFLFCILLRVFLCGIASVNTVLYYDRHWKSEPRQSRPHQSQHKPLRLFPATAYNGDVALHCWLSWHVSSRGLDSVVGWLGVGGSWQEMAPSHLGEDRRQDLSFGAQRAPGSQSNAGTGRRPGRAASLSSAGLAGNWQSHGSCLHLNSPPGTWAS